MSAEDTAGTRPTGRALLVVFIVAAAAFMEGLDATIIVTALPKMAQTFQTSVVAMSIGLTTYMLAVAVLTPTTGWMADRFGARNVFAIAMVVFMATSVGCGLSDGLTEFAMWRLLQGAGGALMTSTGRLIVFRNTPKSQLVRAINWMTVPMLIGPAVGPPIGGFLTEYVSWRAGFFLNVPIGLAGVVAVLLFIPKTAGERRPFDVTGFALNGAALTALIWGMQGLAGEAGSLLMGALVTAASVPLIWLAIRHARRAEHPLVSLAPFQNPMFRMTTLGGGNFMRMSMGSVGFFMPLMFQIGLGLSPLVSGLLVLAHVAGDLVVKSVTTRTIQHFGFRQIMIWSILVYAAGLFVFVVFNHQTPVWLMGVLVFLSGAARSLQMTGLTSLQYADVPQPQMSAASTLGAVSMQATRALTIALAAMLLQAIARIGGRPADALTLGDFHVAFAIAALVATIGVLWYVRMPADAGDELRAR
jgi:EmrB/QacA subfamily drug resistance transporter